MFLRTKNIEKSVEMPLKMSDLERKTFSMVVKLAFLQQSNLYDVKNCKKCQATYKSMVKLPCKLDYGCIQLRKYRLVSKISLELHYHSSARFCQIEDL